MKTFAVEIEGVSPLLMHRYCGEEPSQAKPPRGGKTQGFIDAARKRDWMRSAYHDGAGFHIPPEVIEAAISSGASQFRKGAEVERSVSVVEDRIALMIPNGNGWHDLDVSLDAVFSKPEHVDVRGVGLGSGKRRVRIDRCRPIFRNWRLKFTLIFDEGKMGADEIKKSLGNMCIGDFRPRFGRLRVMKFDES